VNATAKFSLRTLAVVLTFFGVMLASGRMLVAAPISSDEFLVTAPGGAPVILDVFIPEGGGPAMEPSAILVPPGVGIGPIVPPGGLAAVVPPGPIAGATYVILTEPAGEAPDPAELPPVIYPGPNGPVVVSDVIVNGINNQAGLPPFISFISDNNPDLALAIAKIPAGLPVPILPETGGLQDITPFLGPAPIIFPGIGPIQVQVQSTVPEPSTIVMALAFAGMGLIGVIRRRRRAA
jgi:MYXO-CTERM domain-containing protein